MVDTVRGVSRSASANCACLHVDLLLSIYVIAKIEGGQERGGCHGLVNHKVCTNAHSGFVWIAQGQTLECLFCLGGY